MNTQLIIGITGLVVLLGAHAWVAINLYMVLGQ